MGRGWPWYGRMPCRRLRHHVGVPALRGNGAAEPVPVCVAVGPCRAADLASRVGTAAGSTAPAAPGWWFRLPRPGGAGDEATGGDDERGDVLSGLAGDLGEH